LLLKPPFKECYRPKIPETFLPDLLLVRKIRTTAIVTPAEMRVTAILIAVEIGNRLKNPTMTEMTMSRPGNPAGLSLVIVGPSKYLILSSNTFAVWFPP
jgi:hypothetical protein